MFSGLPQIPRLDLSKAAIVLLVLLAILYFRPNVLGFMYNNVLGKLVLIAFIVYLTLCHTTAGLLAVVFIAVIAASSGAGHFFEGMEDKEEKKDGEEKKEDDKKKEVDKKKEDKKKETKNPLDLAKAVADASK